MNCCGILEMSVVSQIVQRGLVSNRDSRVRMRLLADVAQMVEQLIRNQ